MGDKSISRRNYGSVSGRLRHECLKSKFIEGVELLVWMINDAVDHEPVNSGDIMNDMDGVKGLDDSKEYDSINSIMIFYC